MDLLNLSIHYEPSYAAKNPVWIGECSDVLYISSIRDPVDMIGSTGTWSPQRRTEICEIKHMVLMYIWWRVLIQLL